ncbi:MAG: hypothetical protein L0216_17015 [Planctomycetales bacterium]|nr:hypothetical protein [Planctomycetales bacterium]
MTFSQILTGSVLGAMAALVGCGAGGGGAPAKSPQEVYDRAKKCADSGKYADLLPLYPPDEQSTVVFVMFFGAGMMTMAKEDAKKELDALAKKHNVKEKKDDKAMANMGDKKAMKEAADKALEGVNKTALFGDLVAFLEKHGDKSMSFKAQFTGELKDLKVEGNKAQGKSGDQTLHFMKVGDNWYVAME